MSWSPPKCHACSSTSTQFESPAWSVQPDTFGVIWRCQDCSLHTLELCALGPEIPEPGACLGCGGQITGDSDCRDCGSNRSAMVAQVGDRCGEQPQLDAVTALADQGLLGLAINALDLRLETLPDDPPTLVAKASLMTRIDHPARAALLLRRAIELGADAPGLPIDLGVALANSGEPRMALHVYDRHLQHETDSSRRAVTLSNIGGCLSALGHPAAAEALHRRAIEADPELLGPRWNLFANLVQRKRYADALDVVEQTIALTSIEADDREGMQAHRAQILTAMRRYDDALKAIDASLASDPEHLARLGMRAGILVKLRRHRAALACINVMLRLDPDNRQACRILDMIEQQRAGASAQMRH